MLDPTSRTLTSAWIETGSSWVTIPQTSVALSRVRGLKLDITFDNERDAASHSHECVD